jgi:hypothetical protein
MKMQRLYRHIEAVQSKRSTYRAYRNALLPSKQAANHGSPINTEAANADRCLRSKEEEAAIWPLMAKLAEKGNDRKGAYPMSVYEEQGWRKCHP